LLVYIILIITILAGQFLVDAGKLRKAYYCKIIGAMFVLLCGLRSKDLGMWDTVTVYLPSFEVITSHSILELLELADTQYKFIGFDLYSKAIGLVCKNSNFYIFMMGAPFYVAVTYVISKYTYKPVHSFLALLAMGYFTYSFSMIRGMLAFAALCMALDAAMQDKWRHMVAWIVLATSFHITSLLFLSVYFIKKIRWTLEKIVMVMGLLLALNGMLPVIWSFFVTKFIKNILPTYNYYGYKGGEMANGMMIIYLLILLVTLAKLIVSRKLSFKLKKLNIKIRRQNKEKLRLPIDESVNLLIGMSVSAVALISCTSFLSEMIRVAMIMGLGTVLLAGARVDISKKNMRVFAGIEILQGCLLLYYFVAAALPNMNSIPYVFFWQ
jgi:hypothetical protein